MQRFNLYVILFLFSLTPHLSLSAVNPINLPIDKSATTEKAPVDINVLELNLESVNTKLIAHVARKKAPEKMIIVDPRKHSWRAYAANGKLVRSGLATAGSSWCPDIGRPCRTKVGVFRVYSLGSSSCVSKKYPVNRGGAPMPYCMYFNGGQGIHGSYQVVPANVSHGCVRVHVSDARWLRNNFVNVGTKVIVKPY